MSDMPHSSTSGASSLPDCTVSIGADAVGSSSTNRTGSIRTSWPQPGQNDATMSSGDVQSSVMGGTDDMTDSAGEFMAAFALDAD